MDEGQYNDVKGGTKRSTKHFTEDQRLSNMNP